MTCRSFRYCERRLGGQPGVCPAQVLAHVGVGRGEALDVGLVDDRVGERGARGLVALPVKEVVDDDGPGDGAGVVLVVELQVGVLGVLETVGRDVGQHVGVVRPIHHAVDRLGVGVDQQLVGVEAVPLHRRVGPVHAIAVALPRPDPGQVAVPVVRPAGVDVDRRLVALVVEQAQRDALGVLGEEAEVGPVAVPGGPEREGPTRPDLRHWTSAPAIAGSLSDPALSCASPPALSSIVCPWHGMVTGPVPKLQASS